MTDSISFPAVVSVSENGDVVLTPIGPKGAVVIGGVAARTLISKLGDIAFQSHDGADTYQFVYLHQVDDVWQIDPSGRGSSFGGEVSWMYDGHNADDAENNIGAPTKCRPWNFYLLNDAHIGHDLYLSGVVKTHLEVTNYVSATQIRLNGSAALSQDTNASVTTLNGKGIPVADGTAVPIFDANNGLVSLTASVDNDGLLLQISQSLPVRMIPSTSTVFSVIKDNPGTSNFYLESGKIMAQNKRGSSRTYTPSALV